MVAEAPWARARREAARNFILDLKLFDEEMIPQNVNAKMVEGGTDAMAFRVPIQKRFKWRGFTAKYRRLVFDTYAHLQNHLPIVLNNRVVQHIRSYNIFIMEIR